MLAQEFISYIEKTAPLQFSASWDNSGIQVAGLKQELKTIALALDPTLACIKSALEQKADFILCHHPLSLSPRLPNRLDDFHQILSSLLASRVCLYSAHTSLDTNPNGPVSWLGYSLGLKDMKVLELTGQDENGQDTGFGFIGNLAQTIDRDKFCTHLKSASINSWRAIGDWPQKIKTIACCPGSGSSLAAKAFSLGAQVFLTGDFKYHQAQDLENKGFILDVGHFILEEIMMQTWAEQLRTQLAPQRIKVIFIPGKDPFKFEQNA